MLIFNIYNRKTKIKKPHKYPIIENSEINGDILQWNLINAFSMLYIGCSELCQTVRGEKCSQDYLWVVGLCRVFLKCV